MTDARDINPQSDPQEPIPLGSDHTGNEQEFLPVETKNALTEPIIVENVLWTSANPQAYAGGVPSQITHLRELEFEDKSNNGRWAALDIIPTKAAFDLVDKEMATAAFNWFFSIQPDDLPERMIGADSTFYLQWLLDHWAGKKGALADEAVAEYRRCFDAEMIRATCEEFRAAASIDLTHDQTDKDRRITCPTLVLWSATSMWARHNILELWRARADDVRGLALECGHFLPEEDPEQTATELIRFIS